MLLLSYLSRIPVSTRFKRLPRRYRLYRLRQLFVRDVRPGSLGSVPCWSTSVPTNAALCLSLHARYPRAISPLAISGISNDMSCGCIPSWTIVEYANAFTFQPDIYPSQLLPLLLILTSFLFLRLNQNSARSVSEFHRGFFYPKHIFFCLKNSVSA